jgi:predicted metal-dependent peptidase
MNQRPEVISKLAMFLLDKEPLVYLFIINSDFIPEKGFLEKTHGYAGVQFINKRVKFYYDPDSFAKFSAEEIYFIILHEAQHIFKKHLEIYKDFKCNPMLLNIAMDSVINEEISSMTVPYKLIPKQLEGTAKIPNEYKKEFADLGKDAFVSKRMYYWYLEKAKENWEKVKKQLMKVGSYVHINGTDKYGRIESIEKGEYTIDTMSKEEMFDDLKEKKDHGKKENHKGNELTPVVFGKDAYHGDKAEDQTIGAGHEEPTDEKERIDVEIFTRKLVQQAKEIEKNIQRSAGSEIGHFTKQIEKLLEPKVDWKKVLNRHLNMYFSKNSSKKEMKKSFITYPWNPKSRNGEMLFKHKIETIAKLQTYVILAIDASGSIFCSQDELERFFAEIEDMAKWLNFTKSGDVLTIQWDSEIKEGLTEYKSKDWKKFINGRRNIKGGGGTTPESVFRYIDKVFKDEGEYYHVKDGKTNFIIENKEKLPYLIFLTDGFFFNKLKWKDLGIYKESRDDILFFTRSKDCLYKDANYFIYE